MGLAHCTLALENETKEFYVMVQLIPRLIHYMEEYLYSKLEGISSKVKRKPVTALTLNILFGAGLIG